MVEVINTKILKVKTFFDFTSEETTFLTQTQEGKAIYHSLRQPQYHSFYLCGNKLVELDRDRETLLAYFFRDLDMRHRLFRYSTNPLPSNMEKWMANLTEGIYTETDGFAKLATSSYGHPYVYKMPLSSDIGYKIHREVVKYKEPDLFLYFIHSYLATENFYYEGFWDYLVSNSRKNLLLHEMSDFIIYKEQAIFLGCQIISLFAGVIEQDFESEIAFRWTRDLGLGLIKYSDVLPSDTSNFYKDLSSFDLSLLDRYPELKSKVVTSKYFYLCIWVFYFSPIAFPFRYKSEKKVMFF